MELNKEERKVKVRKWKEKEILWVEGIGGKWKGLEKRRGKVKVRKGEEKEEILRVEGRGGKWKGSREKRESQSQERGGACK